MHIRSEEQRCKELISILKARYPQKEHKAASDLLQKYKKWITYVSIAGPVVLSLMFTIFPWEGTWKKANNYIDIILTIVLIVGLMHLIGKGSLYSKTVSLIETTKEHQQQLNDSLLKKIDLLQGDKSYYISTAEHIGISIKKGNKDLISLSKVMVASLYDKLTKIIHGDNVTINIYEVKDGILRMLTSFTHLIYAENQENVDNPIIFLENGIDIKSAEIQEYYCVRCIKGKVKARNERYILPNWQTIAKEFKWDKWEPENKEEIIQNSNREKCLELGFRYNQYVGLKWRRDDSIIWYLEIIANDDTILDKNDDIQKVARHIQETCAPMINIIWDISIK